MHITTYYNIIQMMMEASYDDDQDTTGIITEFVLRIPLNSKVGSSLKSDGTRRYESPTSITGTGTSMTSRRLVTLLSDESATVDILCRTSRMEREGDKDL